MKSLTYFRIASLFGACLAALSLGTAASALTITNGNFQANASSFKTFPGIVGQSGNPTGITGWIVSANAGINGPGDSFTPYFPSSDEIYTSADVDTGTSVVDSALLGGGAGFLTQDLTFAPDTTYTLTVDVAARAGYPTPFPYFIIDDGDTTTSAPSAYGSNLDFTSTHFTENTITFTTVNGGSGYIKFANDPSGGNYDGDDNTALFTNVTLSAPEPATTAMLLMGGLLTVALIRRRAVRL